MKIVAIVLAASVMVSCLLFAGKADYQDAVAQENEYCTNVRLGMWPDYNNNFSEVCR